MVMGKYNKDYIKNKIKEYQNFPLGTNELNFI